MLDHYDFDFGGTLLGSGKIDVVGCGDVPGDILDPVGNRRRVTEATGPCRIQTPCFSGWTLAGDGEA